MNRKQILFAFIALAVLSGSAAAYLQKGALMTALFPSSTENTLTAKAPDPSSAALVGRAVAKYVSQNLTALSPVKNTALRTTKIQISNGTGVIEYTDGKTSYKANFTYQVNGNGNVSILSFKLQK